MKYNFEHIKDCPLIKKCGLPTDNSKDWKCWGFEDKAFWLPSSDERCEKCPHKRKPI